MAPPCIRSRGDTSAVDRGSRSHGATVDTAQLRQYMNKARKLHADNIPVIVAGTSYHIWGANVRLGNVPDTGTDADERRGWARPVFHEQIFIRQ